MCYFDICSHCVAVFIRKCIFRLHLIISVGLNNLTALEDLEPLKINLFFDLNTTPYFLWVFSLPPCLVNF